MECKLEVEFIWKDKTIEGDSPVHKSNLLPSSILSKAEHVKFCLNLPGPSGKAKYFKRPIVNQYREGKVKRTANSGVK